MALSVVAVDAGRVAEPTVLASWTATVVRALEANGYDGEALAQRAGIDLATLHLPGARVPLSHTTELWRLAVEATGNPCFGIDVSRYVGPGTFHGLSIGILASVSLREAIERIARFGSVVLSDPLRSSVVDHEDRYELHLRPPASAPEPAHESIEAVLGSIVRTARFLSRSDLAPVEVHLRRPAQPPTDRFERFFRCPVRYGRDHYLLAYAVADVVQPLPSGCAEAALAADATVARYLERVRSSGPVADRVREVVATLLATGDATPAAVAAQLAMSERTLQRRLHEEDTRFRDVVAEVRIVMAKHLLVAERLTTEQVAARVGLSDPTTFRRAFKRETGMTPHEYARRLG
jgi:AraC-like DNA-binding protein